MGWTKRQFVTKAFAKAGLASYVYDLTSDQLQDALSSLDAMMASWNAKGIRLGYPLPSSPSSSSLDDETGVPDSSNEAIYLNLSLRIGPDFGKIVPNDTKIAAKDAYNTLLSLASLPAEMQLPGLMPAGQGSKPWSSTNGPFLAPPTDALLAGQDSPLEFD